MASFNKVLLMGNLTRDPEVTYTAGQTALCKFGLAVNRKRKAADGTSRDEVCFVECAAWGKLGEIIKQYCHKGAPLFVEGRLVFNTWTASDGSKRSNHSVTVEGMQLLGRKQEQQSASQPEEFDCPF